MPEVLIYNIREPSKNQKVEYEFGDETLETIVKKYDENASTFTCRIAIGEEVFSFWDIPIEACLEYGDSISIYFYERFYERSSNPRHQILVQSLIGKTITISLNPDSTIEELKAAIEEIDHIPADQQRILFAGEQHDNDRTLRDCSIIFESTVHVLHRLLGGGGFSFANISAAEQLRSLNSSAPDWRTLDYGLNLEGRCENPSCKAFGKMVIMQMGSPIVYKLGFPHKKPTNCPMCTKYVKPETCGFFGCSFRFLGIMETKDGPQKYKSDWKETSVDKYHRFDEENKCNWISLVIETNGNSCQRSITRSFSCSVCFSINNENLQGFTNCEHKVHAKCVMFLKTQECFQCTINSKGRS